MDLPKGHWIHGAMAKEKARVGKKGASAPSKKPTKKGGIAPMGNGQPTLDAANASGDGYGAKNEMQRGGANNGYTC